MDVRFKNSLAYLVYLYHTLYRKIVRQREARHRVVDRVFSRSEA